MSHVSVIPVRHVALLEHLLAVGLSFATPSHVCISQDLKEQLPGEQLVYVAAFAVGAQLMYADRPKDTTIRRLYNMTSLAGTCNAAVLALLPA